MEKKAFTGWKHIFDFTWKQAIEGKGFKNVTVILALVLLVGGMAISVLMAYFQKQSAEKESPIETVYVLDESGLAVLMVDSFTEMYGEAYPSLKFAALEGDWKAVASDLATENSQDMILRITHEEEKYLVTAILLEESLLQESDGEDFLADFELCMEQSKLLSSGIAAEKLVYAMSNVSSQLYSAGEEEQSVGEQLVSMLLPMIVVFALYFMTILYGQSITNIVSIEKSSKLMEMMLTMVRPEALIFGKISSTVIIALLQFGLWLVCFVGGFFGGDLLAKTIIYPEYNNVILEVFRLIQSQDGSTAFTPGAILLFVLAMCLGFLFYCVVAGLIASFASKTEEVAVCSAYFQIAVVVGFIGAYVLPLQEKEWLNILLRIFPLTASYLLPGDILVGNVTVWQGLLYLICLFFFTLLFVVLAGKVYKSQVFNRGMSVFERLKKKKA